MRTLRIRSGVKDKYLGSCWIVKPSIRVGASYRSVVARTFGLVGVGTDPCFFERWRACMACFCSVEAAAPMLCRNGSSNVKHSTSPLQGKPGRAHQALAHGTCVQQTWAWKISRSRLQVQVCLQRCRNLVDLKEDVLLAAAVSCRQLPAASCQPPATSRPRQLQHSSGSSPARRSAC